MNLTSRSTEVKCLPIFRDSENLRISGLLIFLWASRDKILLELLETLSEVKSLIFNHLQKYRNGNKRVKVCFS